MTTFWYKCVCFLQTVVFVSASILPCPHYPDPKNGRMICDHLMGKYCTPSCESGYEPAMLPAWAYVCNPVTQRWMTYPESYPLPWPDCVQKTSTKNTIQEISGDKRGQLKDLHTNNATTSQNQTTPTKSDLKSISSTLFENSTRALSYQVVEQHENNRTMKNEIDVQNVSYGKVDNHPEIDIENISIVATRNKVPNDLKRASNKISNKNRDEIQTQHNLQKKTADISQQKSEPVLFHGLTSTSKVNPSKKTIQDPSSITNQIKPQHINILEKKDKVESATNTSSVNLPSLNESSLYTQLKSAQNSVMKDLVNSSQDNSSVILLSNSTENNKVIQTNENQTTATVKSSNISSTNSSLDKETIVNKAFPANHTETNSLQKSKDDGNHTQELSNVNKTMNELNGSNKTRNTYEQSSNASLSSKTSSGAVENNQVSNKALDLGKEVGQKSNDKTEHEKEVSEATKIKVLETARDVKEMKSQLAQLLKNTEETRTLNEKAKVNENGTVILNETRVTNKTNENKVNKISNKSKIIEKEKIKPEKLSAKIYQPPLIPVFSEKDLRLLRSMVAGNNKNSKRSELKQSYSSLWNKMLNLATKRDGGSPTHKFQMATRKQLAYRDSSLAKFIMSNVNKHGDYKFHDVVNPFLYGLTHKPLPIRPSKFKEVTPNTRQYVWNGATFVPISGTSDPVSYLNSAEGGGLSGKSDWKWNGATFVPNDDTVSSKVLTEKKFPEVSTEKKFPDDVTNKQIQNILDMWNGGASKSVLEKTDYKKPDDTIIPGDSSTPTKPATTINNVADSYKSLSKQSENNEISSFPPENLPNTPNPSTEYAKVEAEKPDTQQYYWSGEKYEPITSTAALPQGTIKYRHDGFNSYLPIGQIPYDQFTSASTNTQTDLTTTPSAQTNNPYASATIPKTTPLEASSISSMQSQRDTTNENNNDFHPYSQPYEWNGSQWLPAAQYDPKKIQDRLNAGLAASSVNDSTDSRSIYESSKQTEIKSENKNVENILQSHYPSTPEVNDNKFITTTLAPEKLENLFQAPVSYPTQSIDRKQEQNEGGGLTKVQNSIQEIKGGDLTQGKNSTGETVISENVNLPKTTPPPTATLAVVTSTKVAEALLSTMETPKSFSQDTNLFTSPIEKPQSTHTLNILLPPDNPYAPETNKKVHSEERPNHNLDQIHSSNNNNGLESKNVKQLTKVIIIAPKNPYLNHLPKTDPHPANPFREDAEDLQSVIETDLDLKREIEWISKIYENSPSTTIIDIPNSLSNARSSTATRPRNIDQELDNDLQNKGPDDTVAEHDIEKADQYLQKEEDNQNYATPNADVKSNEESNDDEVRKSQKLKELLKYKAVENNEVHNDLLNSNSLDNMSIKEKGQLENTLEQDIDKLQTGNIGDQDKKSVSSNTKVEVIENGLAKNKLPLTVADIRDLLKLTQLFEHNKAEKKHGLPYPKTRVIQLLRKPAIRNFIIYIANTHQTNSKQRQSIQQQQKHKKKIYKEALTKVLSTWNTQYKNLAKKKENPLPRFAKRFQIQH